MRICINIIHSRSSIPQWTYFQHFHSRFEHTSVAQEFVATQGKSLNFTVRFSVGPEIGEVCNEGGDPSSFRGRGWPPEPGANLSGK